MSKPLLLLDGDQYLYKATVACEREVRWDTDNHVLGSNASEAFDLCMGLIEKTTNTLNSNRIQIALSAGLNFRKEIAQSYKGNRVIVRKPLCYFEVMERLKKAYRCLGVDGLEADDLMGIWQTKDPTQDTIIVSEDKDMKTIPGKLYRQGVLADITEAEANWNFLYQTLTGDSTDGYSGCPGVGPAGATKILNADPSWASVVAAYEKAGLDENDALVQARLARILRVSDWDSVTRKPILWSPS